MFGGKKGRRARTDGTGFRPDSGLGEEGANLEENDRHDEFMEVSMRGWEFRANGDLDNALRCFEEALEIEPLNPDAWNNKGCVLGEIAEMRSIDSNKGEDALREALECHERALELDPNDGASWSNKGKVLLLLSRTEEALDCYDRSTELDPKNSTLWQNRGLAYLWGEYYADALEFFNKAVELDPNNTEAWLQKYHIHGRWGELWEMAECFEQIERIMAEEQGKDEE